MLGKLLKYELKATGRVLLPIYGVLIILATLNRISLELDKVNNENVLGDVFQTICMLAYIFTIAAVSIGTLIIIIQRFYKNLLGDEGYLMNTLPVKAWHNITSKLITGMIWTFLSGIIGVISILIMSKVKLSAISKVWESIIKIFENGYSEFGATFVWSIIALMVLIIVSSIASIIHIYASIAIGHMAEKSKILASLGAYIGTSIIVNLIVSPISNNCIIGNMFLISYNRTDMVASYAIINKVFLYAIIIQLIITIVYFFITNYILNKKLNLE